MRDLDLIRQCTHCWGKALVAQDDGLEVEGETPQLADRRTVSLECAPDDLSRLVGPSLPDRVQSCIEQQRDARERLNRAVVQLVCKSAPFVLLRRDDLVREARALGLAHLRVLEQLRVLVLARGEVPEHRGADHVVALERLLAGEA